MLKQYSIDYDNGRWLIVQRGPSLSEIQVITIKDLLNREIISDFSILKKLAGQISKSLGFTLGRGNWNVVFLHTNNFAKKLQCSEKYYIILKRIDELKVFIWLNKLEVKFCETILPFIDLQFNYTLSFLYYNQFKLNLASKIENLHARQQVATQRLFKLLSLTPSIKAIKRQNLPSSVDLLVRSFYKFTYHKKAVQLILRSPQEIENLHTQNQKKQAKKQWSVVKQKTEKFKVSLIGLPNCGKSSLFNCLAGERLAIVDKEYGMTRDRRQFTILKGLVTIVDTPGIQVSLLSNTKAGNKFFFQQESRTQLKKDIFQQSLNAISESDMILFVIDSNKQGLSEEQITLAKYLKIFNSKQNHQKCQLVLVCNKCDGSGWNKEDLLNQIYSKLKLFNDLEKQDPIFYCSAEEGSGVFQILQYINKKIPFELKEANEKLRKQRRQKFEKLVKKIKEQIKSINQRISTQEGAKQSQQNKSEKNQSKTQEPTLSNLKSTTKRIKIKQWENDFRKLNPNPEENEELDLENYEDHFLRPQQTFSASKRGVDIKNIRMKHSIKICFFGKPNVGKSSLINQLLEDQKMVVSDVPHTTRDALTTKILYKNRKIQLIDTAGLNTPKIAQNEEQYIRKTQISTILHVQESHVVVYVMDAFSAFKVDDFKLINRVVKEGRPVVIVVNKWESVKEQYRAKAKRYLSLQLQKNLGQLHGCPIVFVSAKMLMNIDQMMDQIIATYDKWNKRISTGLLNNWLQKFKKLDNLPKDRQCTLKINYIIQARVRPPHFIIFINKKDIFKSNYMRFLMKNLAQEFQLDGLPLRHTLRSTNNKENQYTKRKRTPKLKKKSKTTMRMEELKKKYGDFTI